MTIGTFNGRLARLTADIRTLTGYLLPNTAPNTAQQTVPANESWELMGVSVTATTTATVGNRTILIRVRNSAGNVFYQTAVSANLAASQTNAIRNFFFGGSPALAQNLFVPSGLIVEAFDAAAIDAAADVLSLHVITRRHFSPG